MAPSRPDRVYAMVDAPEGGLYRSDDAGATWTRTSGDRRIWGRGWYFGGVAVEPRDPDVVYALQHRAVPLARRRARRSCPIKGAPGGDDYHELWIDPEHPERRILGVDQGAVVSLNGGETWSSWYNQPTGQMYHVITDNRFPYWVYGAQQDSGAAGVPSRTTTIDGITMMNFREITAGGESDMIAPDPKDPEVIYGGRVEKLDLRTQQTQTIDPTLALSRRRPRDLDAAPRLLAARSARPLLRARAALPHRRRRPALDRDQPRPDPRGPGRAGQPRPRHRRATSRARAAVAASSTRSRPRASPTATSGSAPTTAWSGARATRARTGRTSRPPALTPWSKVGIIETSHFDAETAYAAVDRHRLDDFRPYVYRTHDGGRTWTAGRRAESRTGSFVNVVREDPVRRGLLYAGTEKGVYVSFDDGDHWQPLQLNLPVTSVRDIDVHGNDLVIATHGRAFWILDDVTPLRQIDARGRGAGPSLRARRRRPRAARPASRARRCRRTSRWRRTRRSARTSTTS